MHFKKTLKKERQVKTMAKKKIGIIGGGISGAGLAYHLSLYEGEADVTVFEKDTIGGASTAKSAGTVCLFDDSLKNRYWDVRLYGFESYLKMEEEEKGSAGFDKTGTLTKGEFKVSGINAVGCSEKELLEVAAYSESYSTHPIAESIKNAYGEKIDTSKLQNVEEIAGHGIHAQFAGKDVFVGNEKLMNKQNISYEKCDAIGTIIYVAIDGKFAGSLVISDEIKEGAKEAISDMKHVGVRKTVMLSGDQKEIVEKVAGELGIDEYHAQLLPADKVDRVEKLLEQKSEKDKVAFVGDGINDAPVLTRADIGIAMGSMGSDAAIEAADVVLMDDDVTKIASVVKISRKTLSIVKQNIVFALGVKALVLILGAFGVANMWEAVFADVGVSVIAILNSMRTLKEE